VVYSAFSTKTTEVMEITGDALLQERMVSDPVAGVMTAAFVAFARSLFLR
jgi:hypothetical protein